MNIVAEILPECVWHLRERTIAEKTSPTIVVRIVLWVILEDTVYSNNSSTEDYVQERI
jgi:hypothetical protein